MRDECSGRDDRQRLPIIVLLADVTGQAVIAAALEAQSYLHALGVDDVLHGVAGLEEFGVAVAMSCMRCATKQALVCSIGWMLQVGVVHDPISVAEREICHRAAVPCPRTSGFSRATTFIGQHFLGMPHLPSVESVLDLCRSVWY